LSSPALVTLLISLKVAFWATAVILPPGIMLGLLLARSEFRGKTFVETVTSLPLVLPPTAVGYLLLLLYFLGVGGYKAEVLVGHMAVDEEFTGGVEGPAGF